jgi:hypothetical protein
LESEKNQKSSEPGKTVADSASKPEGTPGLAARTLPDNKLTNHNELSFGVVYANDLAKPEFAKEKPQFPVGSIIVREKNATATSETPQTIIAMVKREKGFSKKTGDWEFFTFNGSDLKLKTRTTVGECAKCHVRAEKNDWVFRDYLQ